MARLVVGLGNPGSEYEGTRHNVGFAVLDRLAASRDTLFRGPSKLQDWSGPRGFDWARASARNERGDAAFLLKPGTYMNRSGDIVAPVARWLAKRGELALQVVAPADDASDGQELERGPERGPDQKPAPIALQPDPTSILVVYDDMDLDPGRLRLRPHGGHGGQNGMRSIIDRLDSRSFPRLRVGIGRPGTDAARHVLSPFSPAEQTDIDISIAEAIEAIDAWLDGDTFSDVMTRFHSRWN